MAPGASGGQPAQHSLGITLRGRATCAERAAEKYHVASSEPPQKRRVVDLGRSATNVRTTRRQATRGGVGGPPRGSCRRVSRPSFDRDPAAWVVWGGGGGGGCPGAPSPLPPLLFAPPALSPAPP
eukprot:COSAG04_NODE_1980_length_5091_cov_5.303085_1_plen_124_part_10